MDSEREQMTIIGQEIYNYPELEEWFRNKYLGDIQYIHSILNDYLSQFPEMINKKIELNSFIDFCIKHSIIQIEDYSSDSDSEMDLSEE